MVHLEEIGRVHAVGEQEGQSPTWVASDEVGEVVEFAVNDDQEPPARLLGGWGVG